jgi:hypothetical protein
VAQQVDALELEAGELPQRRPTQPAVRTRAR